MSRLEPAFVVAHNDCVHRNQVWWLCPRPHSCLHQLHFLHTRSSHSNFFGALFSPSTRFCKRENFNCFRKKFWKSAQWKLCSSGLELQETNLSDIKQQKNLETNKAQAKVLFLDVEKSFREMKTLLLESSAPCARATAAASRQQLHDMRRWSDDSIMAPERPRKSNQSSRSRNLHAIFSSFAANCIIFSTSWNKKRKLKTLSLEVCSIKTFFLCGENDLILHANRIKGRICPLMRWPGLLWQILFGSSFRKTFFFYSRFKKVCNKFIGTQ